MVAGLASRAEDWPWSSARAHLAGEDDELVKVAPLRELMPDFAGLLAATADPATTARIERSPPSDDRLGRRNGSRRSGAGAAAVWHPASPGQSREWTGTPPENRLCCERSTKLSP